MKIACYIATVIFITFMCLQFNDSGQYGNADWWSWVLFYIVTSVVSLAVAIGKLKEVSVVTGVAGFALGSFVFRMQDEQGNFQFEKFAGRGWFSDEDSGQMVQQTNEAGGLFIVALWLFILAFLMWKSKKTDTTASEAN